MMSVLDQLALPIVPVPTAGGPAGRRLRNSPGR
jgi:hypothetical protein